MTFEKVKNFSRVQNSKWFYLIHMQEQVRILLIN
jgi:hypothetical protein